MIGWWEPEVPVMVAATDADGPIHATAYVSKGQKTLISLGSWSSTNATVKLTFDWATLGLAGSAVKLLTAPAIPSFQTAQSWGVGDSIPVEPKKGWLLVVEPAAEATIRPLKSDDETQLVGKLAAGSKPSTIMTILIDDLGFSDLQPRNPFSPTPHLGQLAYEGVQLEQHYVFQYCSPTRRSILSGRFPVHLWGVQAPTCSNYLPLQFTLLPAKMKQADYETHMIGKGHLSYQTTDHLPINRGFDSHLGYLGGGEQYYHGLSTTQAGSSWPARVGPCYLNKSAPHAPPHCKYDMWQDRAPAPSELTDSIEYSANTYAARAIEKIKATTGLLYIHLTWQNVHSPYLPPPDWENLRNRDFLSNYYGRVGRCFRRTRAATSEALSRFWTTA